MSVNGQTTLSDAILCWPKRLLSAEDLRRHLTGQREIQLVRRTIVTPLAADELRARGIRISWQDATPAAAPTQNAAGCWGYAQERAEPVVAAAVQALSREGVSLVALSASAKVAYAWAREIAECVAQGAWAGGVLFCGDPALVCCVANKVAGLRAAAVLTPAQAAKVRAGFDANLLAVEMPGRTFFELRQILRAIGKPSLSACPAEVAATLKELDGHAHR